MNKPQIALTGADGQLGLTFRELWPDSALADQYELCCSDVAQLDITSPEQIDKTFESGQVAAIVNAAAYTAVDKAEDEPDRANLINAQGPANLARWAAANDARLIHISTDFVFDGAAGSPYRPDARPHPLGAYGASKLAGEQAIRELAPAHSLVLRTSWLYSPFQANFVKTMLRLMAERPELGVVNDQIGSPTSAYSLVRVLFAILEAGAPAGIYHWADAGQISWYDFAVAIQQEAMALGLLQQPIPIRAIATAEYPTPAERPAYSVLDVSGTTAAFGCTQQPWREELKRVMSTILKQTRSGS